MTHPPAPGSRLRRRGVQGLLVVAALLLVPSIAVADADPLRSDGVVVDGREPPRVVARSWIVVDADGGDVLAAKNAHERMRPASTLKTLTAITLLPRLDLDDTYRVRWEDAHVTGSAVGVVPGSRYTIDELFYGLMLPSGNDAARALASAAGGTRRTVTAMNDLAMRLGAHDTVAVNPTGLDAPGQFSSAFDLAIFARAGLTDSDFRRYVTTASFRFPAQEPKRDRRRTSYMIYNQNPLVLEGYRGVLGVKTGYTTQAGRTFVAAARRGGRTLIVALMGVGEPTGDAARRLLGWGFAHGDATTPVGSLDQPEIPVGEPAEQSVPDASVPDTALAGSAVPSEESVTQGSLPILGWLLVGAVLAVTGWWLQRRRPTGPS